MTPTTIAAFRDHAEASFPRESCGIVIDQAGAETYWPCRNIAESDDHFCIHPGDYADAADAGTVLKIVHSHPGTPPTPSDADKVGCEFSGVPWVIVNWPTGNWAEFSPDGFKAPLIGRDFSYGVLDCYTLIQDYYARACGITLPSFEHQDHFWEKGIPLYEDNFAKAGFVVVDSPQPHDVLLMMVGATVANHGAVYLGDNLILHHLMHRLSSVDVYGGYFHKVTVKVLRHKDAASITPITTEAACAL
jgi:proteasome lid subunit RPN8/RPN11